MLDDVLEEFASVDLVLKHMLEWKKKYLESYIEAYVNVCLPKLVGPFVRIEMLTWNPLEVNKSVFTNLNRYNILTSFFITLNFKTNF